MNGQALTAAVLSPPASLLLTLPDALLPEILSWSHDSSAANALLNTCTTLQAVRRDPAAPTLLLLRCRSGDYDSALASCSASCAGGTLAVVQQSLRQLGGGAHSTAAPPLLQALLTASAELGETASVRALLALPRPPAANAEGHQALEAALKGGHRMGALQALLEAGALVSTNCAEHTGCGWVFERAAQTAAGAAALPLLLQHWPTESPAGLLESGLRRALHVAVFGGIPEGMRFLLTAIDTAASGSATRPPGEHVMDAAMQGCPLVLSAVLDHAPLSAAALSCGLMGAVSLHRVACVRLLLDRGAVVGVDGGHSLFAATLQHLHKRVPVAVGSQPASKEAAVCETVELLLNSGAVVTADVLCMAAGLLPCAGLMRLLQRALASSIG